MLANELLQSIIQLTGKTPYRIAKDTGIDKSTLSRMLNGKVEPTLKTISTIAKQYNIAIEVTMYHK